MVGTKRSKGDRFTISDGTHTISPASKLSNGLGSFRDGVLSELTGENKPHSGLNLAGGDRGLLVVPRELGGLLGELLEDVVDEAVHDPHGLARDPDVRVDLLQDLEDVDLVRLDALLAPLLLLVRRADGFLRQLLPRLGFLLRRGLLGYLLRRLLCRRGLLLCGFLSCLWCH
ncbi:hypothetical protein BRARA_D01720 [Brassica rapa]|uniref:Uncharacterized protein n=1 Tax=Brassica campestris TaxID=3711 RepID=A0A397ZT62_BRACM|nr:hypothetical protein BRARA_D01720 [Brassica rapa]